MQDPCNEFYVMLSEFPTYSSWRVQEIEVIFFRFREVVLGLIESEDYNRFHWLADHCPDLEKRIHAMVLLADADKQGRQFNNIVFELRCAIELLMGRLDCSSSEEWAVLISRTSPGDA